MAYSPEETERIKSTIIASLNGGVTRTAAAGAAGICYDTFIAWKEADEKFKDDVSKACNKAISVVEDALYRSATTPDDKGKYNTTAQIFLLCNRARKDWVHVNRVEVTGKDGAPGLSFVITRGEKPKGEGE